MIQLHLLEIAKKHFPELNFDHQDDIIKVEKILKAEVKLNSSIHINDVENLLSFLKNNRGKFTPMLQHKNIALVLKAKGHPINMASFKRGEVTDEALKDFQLIFAENTMQYLHQCIRSNEWNSLKSVFINYTFLVDDLMRENIFQTLKMKNQALVSAINNNRFISFIHSNPFATDVDYFYMLSCIDQFYFDDDIFSLNNVIVSKQKNTQLNLSYLGKILYAVTYFDAYAETLKETLASNQDVALSWAYPSSNSRNKEWSTSGIIWAIVLAVVCLGIFIAVPGGGGAAIGLGIFLVRMITALRKK